MEYKYKYFDTIDEEYIQFSRRAGFPTPARYYYKDF